MSARLIRTVGHGTATEPALVDLLTGAGITALADVRRFPGSRRHPHVDKDEMARWLPAGGIGYLWIPKLGGRRKATLGSRNIGLRNPQFRAYADHMASTEFAEAVGELFEFAASRPTALMCSESLWWRCHRRLLADHLVLVENCRVEHLFHDGHLVEHPVTAEARRVRDHVVYDLPST